MARKMLLAGSCAFVLAALAALLPSSSRGTVPTSKIPCVTSAQCPADKPVCLAGECEDPGDP